MHIREYVDDYIKYYPERWSWKLKNSIEQHDLYMSTRARRTRDYRNSGNVDLLPDFYSIERDAAQFELEHVEWTDFFALIWEGDKGLSAPVGAPNFQGNLYYYYPDGVDADEAGYCISDKYDAYSNQPPLDTYTQVESRDAVCCIDNANVVEAEYKYVVDNHLFKYTNIELRYEDGERLIIIADYTRMRDFYDVYDIMKEKSELVDLKTLQDAFIATCKKRETDFSKDDIAEVLEQVKTDNGLQELRERFRATYFFVGPMEWTEIIEADGEYIKKMAYS